MLDFPAGSQRIPIPDVPGVAYALLGFRVPDDMCIVIVLVIMENILDLVPVRLICPIACDIQHGVPLRLCVDFVYLKHEKKRFN